ncbi:MAG: hypothetical protein ACRD1S_11280, partial [Vicinamibacterales bacterium]
RQCARIAGATRLTVVVSSSPLLGLSGSRAETRVSPMRDGRVQAAVEIRGFREQVELIAHEIEHVIEQLDGVDLSSKAAAPGTGVHRIDHERFETNRAILVGVKVAQEVRGPGG